MKIKAFGSLILAVSLGLAWFFYGAAMPIVLFLLVWGSRLEDVK